jgi:hypothetical protein
MPKEKAGMWKAFATGESGNSLLDLLCEMRGGDFGAANSSLRMPHPWECQHPFFSKRSPKLWEKTQSSLVKLSPIPSAGVFRRLASHLTRDWLFRDTNPPPYAREIVAMG